MKRMITILFALIPASVMANECPRLAGNYTCSNGAKVTIPHGATPKGDAQYLVRGLLNGDLPLVTDNLAHAMSGATLTSFCKNSAVYTQMDHERGRLSFNFKKNGAVLLIDSGMGQISCK